MSFQIELLPAEKRVLSKIKIELKMLTRNALNANIKRLNDIFKIIKRMESDPELQEAIIKLLEIKYLYKYIMTEYSPDMY